MKTNNYGKPLIWLMVLVFLFSLTTPVMANGVKIVIDGQPMNFQADSEPFISNSRTLVPLRAISEYFDCEVEWVPKGEYDTGNVYITPRNQSGKYEMFYTFYIGINEYMYSGPNGDVEEEYRPKVFELDVPPIIKNDRTFVPLRVIGEIFGKVDWNGDTRTVTITTGANPKPPCPCNSLGMSKTFQNLSDAFGPNGEIQFRTIDLKMTPQVVFDVFSQEPMDQVYTNEKYNYEVYYPKKFNIQPETDVGDGRALLQTNDMEIIVWGGHIPEENYANFMKSYAPDAKTALLDDFIVYIDKHDKDGFLTITKYITDGNTYMAIKIGGAKSVLTEKPSDLILNRLDYALLFCENALHHFAETHQAPEMKF